jgi:hypothetical protein
LCAAAALRTQEKINIESARRRQVMNGKGKMKRGQAVSSMV